MKTFINRIFNKWLIQPFTRFLNTGLSADKLAQSFAIGICLGLMPFPGTTLTCTAAAILFRLNFGAIQLINYMVAPLQLILIYPFFKIGAAFTGTHIMSGTIEVFTEKLKVTPWQTLYELGFTSVIALIVWVLVSLPLGLILFKISLPVFRRITSKTDQEEAV
ncbi:MAG: DUF2062 domain-containing protein [Bacteroidales bacterium]|nr:DUF2062 domain-containing protein [Bacteroidales bacterium]